MYSKFRERMLPHKSTIYLLLYKSETWYLIFRADRMVVFENKTGNISVTLHSGAFVQPLLQWKSNKYYIF